MSRIQIYYFSGTGNTAFIVNKIAEKLRLSGNEVNLSSCEECKSIDHDFDVLGIAFPIHSSYAPKVFSSFLDKLPNKNATPLFGIVTSGYMAGDVLSFEGKRLERKGYIPFLYRNIIVGNNLHLPILCPLKVTKKQEINKRLIKIDNQIEDIVKKIDNRSKDMRGNDLFGRLFGVLQRSIGKVHEELNFKGFSSDEKCTRCKWCIKSCPTNNIIFKDDKIVFENRCIICMRCYNFCPNKAIQMTNKTKNITKYIRYDGPEGLGIRTMFNKNK
ncbi:4Fe-4S binding protein [Clostridium sp. P21]|uniref:4Fe-4S binding protein n=1 Tax=Clostridium muellerianum TaxID=2716538 RepID=A0A7Y0HNE0_9CLOT|nr:EFR1 family ferrodoxin [Clostridium muellerianum]NMM63060.1 4Fe-4S binding protein [Clostridium muellerianum]